MDELAGRVALVTGSSRGIGRGAALALARAGADVAVNYRSAHKEADEVERQILALGRRSVSVQADMSVSREVERVAEEVRARLGPVDILVNNAGIARVQKPEEITEADWNELIRVNLTSCFLMTQAVLPGMRERRWGRIINLSSVAAHIGGVVGVHYAASKAGIIGLTHGYASALFREGITANAISPALIETDMVRSNALAQPERIPIGRFGTEDEVADVVVMLARNGYMTGQTIHVNGGMYLS